MWNRTSGLLAEVNSTGTGHSYTTSSTLQNVTGNTSVPKGCLAVRFEEMEFVPWDNLDNIVTSEVENIARRVKDTLLFILFLIGGPANVINMAVFYKQGLKERVSLCLFALSLADEIYLTQAMFFYGEQLQVQFTTKERYGPIMRIMVNSNMVGFFGFCWVSQVLSAIIASERCLCVLSPLRFQDLLQTRTLAAIIATVYLVVVSIYFLVATRYRITCVFDLSSGIDLYTGVTGEFYLNHEKLVNYLDSFVYGASIPGVVIITVTTSTILTTMKIRQAAAWRAGTSSASGLSSSSSLSSSPISPREVALTKMLIGTSVLFIVCVTPFALFRFVWFFLPEMDIGRRYHNLYLAGLWIAEPFSYVNSSFNIFVYYTMGSRYRKTFWALFGMLKWEKAKERKCITKTSKHFTK